jgi:hypothetical protein
MPTTAVEEESLLCASTHEQRKLEAEAADEAQRMDEKNVDEQS